MTIADPSHLISLLLCFQTVDQWVRAGYADDPQYATFKQLLEAPVGDAKGILQDRFPMPRYILTAYEQSQVGTKRVGR